MTTTSTSGSTAATAREQARQVDGRFGQQPHTDPGQVVPDTPARSWLCRPGREAFEQALAPDESWHLEPQSLSHGRWSLADPGGLPHLRTRTHAAAVAYREAHDEAACARDGRRWDRFSANRQVAQAHQWQRQRVTAVLLDSDSGRVAAQEGLLVIGTCGDLTLLERDSTTRSQWLTRAPLLDIVPGYGRGQELADGFGQARSQLVPAVDPLPEGGAFDDVPDEGRHGVCSQVAAAYMLDHRVGGSRAMPGCLFLATDRQPGAGPGGDDIVSGYLWAPEATHDYCSVCPETGSFFGADLRARGGKLRDFAPGSINIAECLATIPDDRRQAYRRVMGVSYVADRCGSDRW